MSAPIISRQCQNCKHYRGVIERPPDPDFDLSDFRTDQPEPFGCTAFPAGIPDDILEERFDHRNAHDGDGGVQFLPASLRSTAVVQAMTFGGQV